MRDTLRGSWEWLAFAASLPADPVPFSGLTANTLLLSGRVIVTGLGFYNASTQAGGLNLIDGMDASGNLVAPIGVGSAAGATWDPGGQGVLFEQGVFLQPTNLVAHGCVYCIHLWKYKNTPPGE